MSLDDATPYCQGPECGRPADFWLFLPGDGWQSRCKRHVVHLHPSLELHAWLAAGFARPVERGRPTDPPDGPRGGRAAAFRSAIEDALE